MGDKGDVLSEGVTIVNPVHFPLLVGDVGPVVFLIHVLMKSFLSIPYQRSCGSWGM